MLNCTRDEREKRFRLGFCPLFFLSQILISNTWQPFLTTFHICASQQKGVVVVVACTFNEHDERDDDDDDDACERKF